MSDSIHDILKKLSLLEGKTTPVSVKHGLNKQQKGVPQLPALFKPKSIKALGSKTDPAHPMDGYMVGDSVEPKKSALEETMISVEEDMINKVKNNLADYLETLEKKTKIDQRLIRKAKAELNIDDDPETEDVEEEEIVDPAGYSNPALDSEAGHAAELKAQQVLDKPQGPIAPVSESPSKIYELDDGTCLECWGDDDSGFEIHRQGRRLPSKFKNINDVDIAVKLWQKKRANQQGQDNSSQDYVEEK